ncbi:MAG: hypothetical protein QOD97_2496, partial [Mycobacterium sp.]|nr:hypothetical protein [Mycobacterium sp.]
IDAHADAMVAILLPGLAAGESV